MSYYKKYIGNLGETLAEKYLKQNNYIILQKNFRCKLGEIDLIGKNDGYLCFIEVKCRLKDLYGSPGESVNYIKQRKIIRTAKVYILKNKLFNSSFRFDVIEIILTSDLNDFSINIIKNAFQT